MYDYRYFNRAITASEANLIYSQHKVIGDEVLHLPMSDASNNTGITTNLGSYRITESTITNTGNVSTQVWPGDYVAKFSGSNYLTIDYNSALNTSEFTVSLWLRPSIVNQSMWVIDNTMLEDSVNKGFEMKFEGSNARVYFSILDGNAGYQLISTPVLTANKWYHLVFQYNGTKGLIYHNGSFSTDITRGYSPNTSKSFSIGDYKKISGSYEYQGQIFDLRYYNRAISASEVSQIYNGLAILGDEVLHLPLNDRST